MGKSFSKKSFNKKDREKLIERLRNRHYNLIRKLKDPYNDLKPYEYLHFANKFLMLEKEIEIQQCYLQAERSN